MLLEDGGQRSRTGGLSVTLAGSDGHVLGGGVAGILTAAAPVQVCLPLNYVFVSQFQKLVTCLGILLISS